MERFRFGSDVAFAPREELLDGVTVAPLSRSIFHGSPFQAAVFRVVPGGRIARHPASYPQILAVLDGSGKVRAPAASTSQSTRVKQFSGRQAKSMRPRPQAG
jgi:quercetin dioxygenase-like cupin family protein